VTSRKRRRSTIYLVSIGIHLAIAVAIAAIPQERLREVIAIALAETPHHDEPPKRPAEPHPMKPAARAIHAASALHAAPSENAATSDSKASAPYLDLGLSLDSAASDGLAIPASAVIAPKALAIRAEPTKPKVLLARIPEAVCAEEIVKPIALNIAQPQYTPEAERASIEGKVRLSLQISDTGEVESATVLRGIGYGLDESALSAAKRMRFKPGSRCGRNVPTHFVVSFSFKL